MTTKIFRGVVKGGRLVMDRDLIRQYIASFKDGQKLHITIRKPKFIRSNQQNKYYWGVVLELASEHLGHSPEELHDFFKWKYLVDKSEEISIPKSTGSLSTVEFEDYLEKVKRFLALEFQIVIPDPNEIETK